jgi:hypothetical protein
MRRAPSPCARCLRVHGQATRRLHIGHTAPAHRPHCATLAPPLANGRRTPPPTPRRTLAMPRPHRDVIALAWKEAPHRLVLAYKSRRPLPRHRCRHGELPASCVPDGV